MTLLPDARAEERFLILAPTGRDAALTSSLLQKAGMVALVCEDVEELCSRTEREGAMGLMIAEEALIPASIKRIRRLLHEQPSWSDLPILLFSAQAGGPARAVALGAVESLGNVSLLDRPLRPITMLAAANAALRARKHQYTARDELKAQKEAIKQRDQFLAMLGHELRNPLAAITMASELDDEVNGAQYKAIIKRQARHLTRLVDDLLDVSRVTSGKIVLQLLPVDVCELVKRSLQSVRALLETQKLHVHTRFPDEPLIVQADSVRLEQVMVNLLTNAAKYTPAGGHIEVTAVRVGELVELSVRDDGAGIAPEMLPRVFELFTQAEATLDRAKGGMGIGLTLVNSLVQLHHGSVDAHSEGLGKGSVFSVRLPLSSGVDTSPSLRPAERPIETSRREVLIVEDNDDSRELLASMLKRRGHTVASVADGLSGVEVALSTRPAVILVDIGLPGLDGYGVARRVRRALGRDVLLIALTGYGQPEDRARALDAGFDVHLTKPVDFTVLQQLLAHQVEPVQSQVQR